jgi:uncharacterized protein YhbP (UPF0306 family)
MNADDIATVGSFLDSLSTLTLATYGPAGPWAASLFFARDEECNLYFISSQSSRHVQDLLTEPNVAVTVNGDTDNWIEIRGLQISGTAEVVTENEKADVVSLYLQKFSDVRRILSEPSTDEEMKIVRGFTASEFFRIRPKTVRMIDNIKGFGYKAEFVLGETTFSNQTSA